MNTEKCEKIMLILTSILVFIVLFLCLWSMSKSRIKNCCENKDIFANCNKYFGDNFDMSLDKNYNLICN